MGLCKGECGYHELDFDFFLSLKELEKKIGDIENMNFEKFDESVSGL